MRVILQISDSAGIREFDTVFFIIWVNYVIMVTGYAIARVGAEEEMQRLAIEHVLRSRTEFGCISHEVSRDVQQLRRFVFVERWTDMAALQLHFRVEASR